MNTFVTRVKSLKSAKPETLFILLELLLIVVWGCWVGRELLDLNENKIPAGREYGMAVSTHHFWTFVQQCGWCAVWDGSQIGGFPTFANLYAAVLHPVTMITTLLWGVVNGSKWIIVLSLVFAGLAQWWLAYELQVGSIPRLWTAMLAVVGGHLAGKMELGIVDLMLSTALSSFVFPAVLMVARRQDWRSAVLLSLLVASSIFSGQGYIQIFLLFTLPAFGFLLMDREWRLSPLWKKYAAAAGLAILIGSALIIPTLANIWNLHKDINLEFSTVQPVKFSLLNFVVDDLAYFNTDVLEKAALPSLYINFIGWTPILLAIFAVGAAQPEDRKLIFYLAASAALILSVLDGNFLQWLARLIPALTNVRYPTLALGLAVPPILGLAAYGLEHILRRVEWPFLELGVGSRNSRRTYSVPLSVIVLLPLVVTIRQGYQFGRPSLHLQPMPPQTLARLQDLKTDSLQWVMPVFGEHFWKEPAVRMGLKITSNALPFWTGAKHYPEPYYQLTRAPIENQDNEIVVVNEYEDGLLYLDPRAEYAAVIDEQGNIMPCHAAGTGGELDVTCDVRSSGRLIVHENAWTGWKLWIDGKRAELMNMDGWLAAEAPEGRHTFVYRFQPWDVPVGLLLTLLGLGLSAWLWFRKQETSPQQD